MNFSFEQLTHELAALPDTAVVTQTEALQAHRVDGITPKLLCTPATPKALASALKACIDAGAAVVPWGGGTVMALGNPPRQADVVLKTSQLNQILDHDHANLTVTVESGITLSTLQNALAVRNQFVPFDPPDPDRSTVGGIVAANLNGPRRTSDGNVRDLVIGMKVALATGEIVKAGGKVVKNVAGYDMCKLFTGSLGTLGIITELTLRVAPLPEAERSACATGTLEQSLRLAGELAAAKLLPTSVLSSSRADETHWQVTTRFEGFNQAVERQLGDFAAIAERAGMTAKIQLAAEGKEIWRAITRLPLTPQRLVQRLTLPRAALSTVLRDLASWRDSDSELAADLLAGVIWLVAPPSAESSKQFNTLIDLAQRHRGHAVIFNAPAESKAGLDVWGPAAPSLFLMRRIKQHFDPAGRLNPGRFVDFI